MTRSCTSLCDAMTRTRKRDAAAVSGSERMRKRRTRWGHLERKWWTLQDLETLLLHVECFGFEWVLIAQSMQRSPDALRNKLVRLHRNAVWNAFAAARAWLKRLVDALGLEAPAFWGHRDDQWIRSPRDVPAPVFGYVRGTMGHSWNAKAALAVAEAG